MNKTDFVLKIMRSIGVVKKINLLSASVVRGVSRSNRKTSSYFDLFEAVAYQIDRSSNLGYTEICVYVGRYSSRDIDRISSELHQKGFATKQMGQSLMINWT